MNIISKDDEILTISLYSCDCPPSIEENGSLGVCGDDQFIKSVEEWGGGLFPELVMDTSSTPVSIEKGVKRFLRGFEVVAHHTADFNVIRVEQTLMGERRSRDIAEIITCARKRQILGQYDVDVHMKALDGVPRDNGDESAYRMLANSALLGLARGIAECRSKMLSKTLKAVEFYRMQPTVLPSDEKDGAVGCVAFAELAMVGLGRKF